jgi:serine/threonine-protein kinase PknG
VTKVTRCNRADCGRGEIDEQGFCPVCHRRPLDPAAPRPAAAPPPVAEGTRPAVPGPASGAGRAGRAGRAGVAALAPLGVERVRPEPWWGLALARSGRVPAPRPAAPENEEPLEEEHRFCAECGRPVGRGRGGAPGRIRGFCKHCTTEFDFSRPPAGQVFLGRYEYLRKIGIGGQGTTYLVRDRNLGADVVLKMLHSSVAATALAERDALAGLRHDSIVRILSYEPDGPFLVLEHVPGVELTSQTDDPLDVVLAHGLQLLQALDYLHARNLLHCDVKPSNIIRFEDITADRRDRVRLIDFGAVRAFDDASPVTVYSSKYAPPVRHPGTGRPDPEHLRPTAGFDLFCLGQTLAELCMPHLDRAPTARGVDSLRLLIARATDVDTPARRFTTSRQFAEQLSGVIRQLVADPALDRPRQVTRPSVLFGEVSGALDGGLAAPRPLGHWATATVSEEGSLTLPAPFTRPSAGDVLATLPVPLADPDGPGLAPSSAAALAACRNALRSGSAADAQRALGEAELPEWHWIRLWCAGLIGLCRGDVEKAVAQFTAVRRLLPGELVPMLALGLCAELRSDLPLARLHYETLADTAPALGAAGFGLARVHLLSGRRAEAVRAAERLAAAAEYRLAPGPQIAAVRLLVASAGAGAAAPDTADPGRARELAEGLAVDDATRTSLEAEIEYAGYARGGDGSELSETVRRVAAAATTKSEFVALIDLANRLRPPVRWEPPGLAALRRSRRESAASP